MNACLDFGFADLKTIIPGAVVRTLGVKQKLRELLVRKAARSGRGVGVEVNAQKITQFYQRFEFVAEISSIQLPRVMTTVPEMVVLAFLLLLNYDFIFL